MSSYLLVYLGNGFKNPGMYEVPSHYKFSDILSKYDNYYQNGYTSSISLESKLYNSQKIILIPTSPGIATGGSKYDINTITVIPKSFLQCSRDDYLKAKGVGEKTADLIINYIKQNPKISSVDELINIKGVGQKTIDEISKYCN